MTGANLEDNEIQIIDNAPLDEEAFSMADDDDFKPGVDTRPDVEHHRGTSSKDCATLSSVRSPVKLTCQILIKCFNLPRILWFCQTTVGDLLHTYAKQAVQYIARLHAQSKLEEDLSKELLAFLPDTADTSLRRLKFANLTPVLPSGVQVTFFHEYFEIRNLEVTGDKTSLDEETKNVWNIHRDYEAFVQKLQKKNGKNKDGKRIPLTQKQLSAALAEYKITVNGTAKRKPKNDPRAPPAHAPSTPPPAAATGTKRDSSEAGLNLVTDSQKEQQELESALKASEYEFWGFQRDALLQGMTLAEKVMCDQSKTTSCRDAAKFQHAELTLKYRDHLVKEPESSGLPAAAAAGTVPPSIAQKNLTFDSNAKKPAPTPQKKKSGSEAIDDLFDRCPN